jgi:hypothetical protein
MTSVMNLTEFNYPLLNNVVSQSGVEKLAARFGCWMPRVQSRCAGPTYNGKSDLSKVLRYFENEMSRDIMLTSDFIRVRHYAECRS